MQTQSSTLYVSDLDGTLLGTDSRISHNSARILSSLSDRGALITVATARTPATVVPLLEYTRTDIPAIVMTGSAYWLRDTGCFDRSHYMPVDELAIALKLCKAGGVNPFIYVQAADGATLDVYHSGYSLNPAEGKFYAERCNLALKRFHLTTQPPLATAGSTMLLYAMTAENSIKTVAKELRRHTACTVYAYPDIFNPGVYSLEVFPPGVDKARAVLDLKKRLGVRRLVVFGDSINDLSMFAVADTAVAVGNAIDDVRAAADIVIEPNYTDSVARFIAHDFDE